MKKTFLCIITVLFLLLFLFLIPFCTENNKFFCYEHDTPSFKSTIDFDLERYEIIEEMVWIPTKGGKKYHSKKSCSGMIDPDHVKLSVAEERGFTACKKCY